MTSFLLNQLYPKAVAGLPLLDTPEKLAASYLRHGASRARAEAMIGRHIALSGLTGFVTGLGGWLSMPVTLPANLAGVALLQLHMAASCAVLAGRDLDDADARSEVVKCLLKTREGEPNTEQEETLSRVTVKLAEKGVRSITKATFLWGAAAAGRRIGGRIARGVPFLGGAIGAISDAFNTRIVARHTLDTYFPRTSEPKVLEAHDETETV